MQTLIHELSGLECRDRVFKYDRHHGEPQLRQRAHLDLFWQPEQCHFDRVGDEPFHFARWHRRRFGDYYDLVVGKVWESINWNSKERPSPGSHQPDHSRHYHPSVLESEVNDPVQHHSLSIEDFSISDFKIKAPLVTT